jgi:TldD protein
MSTGMATGAGAHRWGSLADDDLADEIMEQALEVGEAAGATVVDVRLGEVEEQRRYLDRRGAPEDRREQNVGIGVRVLLDGAWGFAALPLTGAGVPGLAARRALAVAGAAAGPSGRAVLEPRESSSGTWSVPVDEDPFALDAGVVLAHLTEIAAAARVDPRVVAVQVGCNAKRQHRHFADSGGSRQHQHLMETGAVLVVHAAGDGDLTRRSYPNSFHGNTAAAGWEYVRGLDLVAHADRVGREAVELLGAPRAPGGRADLVIGPAQMALQIHESCGHALEADRILGDEANFAGTSFITPDDIGSLHYGSPAVTIVADPTMPGTRGSFAWDDEGTPAARRRLVTEGVVTEVLSTRDSAARLGRRTSGAARSDGWAYLPVCFATNVFLEPGTGSQDELLDRLGEGYLLEDNRSWSIDEKRLDFQFGTEVAWEVRRGRRGRLLRGFSYGGRTPQFWGSVEAVAGPEEFRAFGMPCGKGEPKQWGFLGHGASPTLVRDIAIGVAG